VLPRLPENSAFEVIAEVSFQEIAMRDAGVVRLSLLLAVLTEARICAFATVSTINRSEQMLPKLNRRWVRPRRPILRRRILWS
jgi:hypothetical protein